MAVVCAHRVVAAARTSERATKNREDISEVRNSGYLFAAVCPLTAPHSPQLARQERNETILSAYDRHDR
jgi:hypothetical protein